MREIKYRAWHWQRKRMFEVRAIDFSLDLQELIGNVCENRSLVGGAS